MDIYYEQDHGREIYIGTSVYGHLTDSGEGGGHLVNRLFTL